MQQQQPPKTGSLKDLGVRRFMDEKYYKYGGFVAAEKWFMQIHDGEASFAGMARAFSPEDRPLSRQAPRDWYEQWEIERGATA